MLSYRIPFKRYLTVLFSIIWVISSQSQTFETLITKVTDQEGKAPSATFAIVEDFQGFLWFGTVDGLYRYDGHNFKIFRNNPSNKNSLSNNTIRDLEFDSKGNLWIATQGGGLNKFNPKTEAFKQYKYSGIGENEIRGNSIWRIFIDKEDNIYAGITGKGVDKLISKTEEIIHYNIAADDYPMGPQDGVRALFVDSDGIIWANYGDKGFTLTNPYTNQVQHHINIGDSENEISGNLVFDIMQDSRDNIWIATYGNGVDKLNKKQNSITHYHSSSINPNSVISDLVYNITERESGNLWITTENGVSEYNPETNLFTNYQNNVCDVNSLSDNRVRCIYIDKKDILWLGNESGVNKLVSLKKFKSYKHISGDEKSLPEGIVRGIYKDSLNNIWIGFIQNGLYTFEANSHEYKYHNLENASNGLFGNHISCITQDSKGYLWVSDWDNGLFKYHEHNDFFEHYAANYHEKNLLTDNRIQTIIEEKPGVLWLGTEGGLNRINTETNEIFYYQNEPGKSNTLSGNSIQANALTFDNDGNLWAGTWENGLNKLEFENDNFKEPKISSWKNIPGDLTTLSNNNVISLYIDNSGIIWIGTFGGGLNRFTPSDNTFKQYTTKDGLPNNIIFSILEDETGNLWMSTDNGLSRFDPKNEVFINYDASDGLQSAHFFWGASHKSYDNEFFFGGIDGLNSFYPNNILRDTTNPPGVLVNLLVNNNPLESDSSITILSGISLNHTQNFLTFEITALDFEEPGKNLYKYKLEGIDKSWIQKGSNRIANYTALEPGKYTFRYIVSNSDGIWSKYENKFEIRIKPPWWKTILARIIFAFLFFGSLYGFYRIRIGILQSQKDRLTEQVNSRTKEIADKNQTLERQKDQLSQRNHELKTTLEELSNTQKALIESEKMASLGILTAGVAHEINNPLNFISVSIDNIKTELEEIKKMECDIGSERITDLNELISHSETGISRISSIIGSLQAFIRNNNEPLEETSPKELVESSVKMLKSKITDNINVNYEFQSTPDIKCKKHQLAQVLINILDNAIYAISEKKIQLKKEEINISIKPFSLYGDKGVMFSISNTGPLIPNEVLKNLFDPFFTTKGPNKGTGLGLYLTYNIVNEHNGTLNVKNVDNKVVFDIFIPHL